MKERDIKREKEREKHDFIWRFEFDYIAEINKIFLFKVYVMKFSINKSEY